MRQNLKSVSPMSNKGRNTYVIEHITEALLSLMQNKGIGEISICELCAQAGVGRASFYRNFQCKEDILRYYLNKLFSKWLNDGAEENKPKPLSEMVYEMFNHFEQHKEFYALLSERRCIYLLKDVIVELCGPKPEHTKLEAYARAYVAYTLYGWIEVWFQRGMEESAEEIAEMFRGQGL